MHPTRLAALIATALFGPAAWATDAATDQVADLQPTVISATRAESTIASIPGSVQVIDAAQVREQTGAGRRIADILGELVPGMAPSSGGMSNYGQTLRGRNTLVLIDGVSQNATRDNFRQLNSIAPESIERIEVISGASSIYGAGASGGIINIITKRNQGQDLAFSSKLGLTAGKDFERKGFAYEGFQSATGRQGPFDWYLSGPIPSATTSSTPTASAFPRTPPRAATWTPTPVICRDAPVTPWTKTAS